MTIHIVVFNARGVFRSHVLLIRVILHYSNREKKLTFKCFVIITQLGYKKKDVDALYNIVDVSVNLAIGSLPKHMHRKKKPSMIVYAAYTLYLLGSCFS